jgi:hypothetical protein
VIGSAFHPTEPLRLVPEPAEQRDDYDTAFDEIEEKMNDTTRRFKRSMHGADGAFVNDPQYANPVFYVGPSWRDRVIDALWWAVALTLVGVLLALWSKGGGPFA